jgi:hypothetical protein
LFEGKDWTAERGEFGRGAVNGLAFATRTHGDDSTKAPGKVRLVQERCRTVGMQHDGIVDLHQSAKDARQPLGVWLRS